MAEMEAAIAVHTPALKKNASKRPESFVQSK
jgi:hypothetical protein